MYNCLLTSCESLQSGLQKSFRRLRQLGLKMNKLRYCAYAMTACRTALRMRTVARMHVDVNNQTSHVSSWRGEYLPFVATASPHSRTWRKCKVISGWGCHTTGLHEE